jgi:hypothetical protein
VLGNEILICKSGAVDAEGARTISLKQYKQQYNKHQCQQYNQQYKNQGAFDRPGQDRGREAQTAL